MLLRPNRATLAFGAFLGAMAWLYTWLGGVFGYESLIWPFAVFTAVPGAFVLRLLHRRIVRRGRWRRGLCLACGYDLRGNVSGHCPECGRRIVAAYRRVLPPDLGSATSYDDAARGRGGAAQQGDVKP